MPMGLKELLDGLGNSVLREMDRLGEGPTKRVDKSLFYKDSNLPISDVDHGISYLARNHKVRLFAEYGRAMIERVV